jgi:hypothetical protein
VKPGIFDKVRSSVRRRVESCAEMRGNHIEHLLYISHTSPIYQQAFVSGDMLTGTLLLI